ncbi:MAG: hypothetical protein U5R48_16445 [Gammaproteobacteria bacterium]|nr:hypothetical protein [Gammaproteobacteria bacterium]
MQCCFLDPVVATPAGRITDPAASSGADALAGVPLDGSGAPLSVLDPAFTDFPPAALLRRQDAPVADFASIAAGTNAAISRFRWEGSTETPVGLFDAETGELLREVDTDLLVLAGRLADVADLTGFRRFSTRTLQAGRLVSESGAFAPRPLEGADISFNVDFASGDIVDGIARIHTDPDDVEQQFRDGFLAFFAGTVASENGSPQASLSLLGGDYEDRDGDAGGFGQVDLERSRMDGFFAGDGDAFNLSFALVSEASDGDGKTGGQLDGGGDFGGGDFGDGAEPPPHEPVSAIGLAVLEEELLQLSAAEQTAFEQPAFEQGIAFVGAECCVDAGTAAGPVAVDGLDRPVPGLNTDGVEDLEPSQAGFLDPTPEQILRIGGAEGILLDAFLPLPGAIDGHQQVAWFGLFSPSLVVDSGSGRHRPAARSAGPVPDRGTGRSGESIRLPHLLRVGGHREHRWRCVPEHRWILQQFRCVLQRPAGYRRDRGRSPDGRELPGRILRSAVRGSGGTGERQPLSRNWGSPGWLLRRQHAA